MGKWKNAIHAWMSEWICAIIYEAGGREAWQCILKWLLVDLTIFLRWLVCLTLGSLMQGAYQNFTRSRFCHGNGRVDPFKWRVPFIGIMKMGIVVVSSALSTAEWKLHTTGLIFLVLSACIGIGIGMVLKVILIAQRVIDEEVIIIQISSKYLNTSYFLSLIIYTH